MKTLQGFNILLANFSAQVVYASDAAEAWMQTVNRGLRAIAIAPVVVTL